MPEPSSTSVAPGPAPASAPPAGFACCPLSPADIAPGGRRFLRSFPVTRGGLPRRRRLADRSLQREGTANRRALQGPSLPAATPHVQTRSHQAARALPARRDGNHDPRDACRLHRQVHTRRHPKPQAAQAAGRLHVPWRHRSSTVPGIAFLAGMRRARLSSPNRRSCPVRVDGAEPHTPARQDANGAWASGTAAVRRAPAFAVRCNSEGA